MLKLAGVPGVARDEQWRKVIAVGKFLEMCYCEICALLPTKDDDRYEVLATEVTMRRGLNE
jgi:hypothetical protein